MSGGHTGTRKIATALLVLIAIAVAGRLAWELLRPVLPVVIVLLAVVAVLGLHGAAPEELVATRGRDAPARCCEIDKLD